MESQPQNPENFHLCNQVISYWLSSGTKVLMYKYNVMYNFMFKCV